MGRLSRRGKGSPNIKKKRPNNGFSEAGKVENT
jgi:hypothetical protein